MIYHWKAYDFEMTEFEYLCDLTYTGEITPSQTLNFKHVEFINFSDNHTCDIPLESS